MSENIRAIFQSAKNKSFVNFEPKDLFLSLYQIILEIFEKQLLIFKSLS